MTGICGLIGSLLVENVAWSVIDKDVSLTWLYLNLIGILGFTAIMLLNFSLLKLEAGYASIIRSTDVIFGYIFQITILKDVGVNYITVIGVCAILLPMVAYIFVTTRMSTRDNQHETIKN